MRTKVVAIAAVGVSIILAGFALKGNSVKKNNPTSKNELSVVKNVTEKKEAENKENSCVFMSLMGEQETEGFAKFKANKEIIPILENGKNWLIQSQSKDGGWSCSTTYQNTNPSSDPATTAMVAMAMHRCGYSFQSGEYKENLANALEYLLSEVEKNTHKEFITQVRNTQIQSKLGQNIDAALVLQFLNQVEDSVKDKNLKARINNAIQVCVNKIEKSYDKNGKVANAGWAGVLQSSFANTALEQAAQNENIKVDKEKINKAREYQKSNFDASTGKAKTEDGAGILLYAVSSSVSGSAIENNEANAVFNKAKKEGKLAKDAEFNRANLKKAGVSDEKALSYETANNVYKAAKVQAMDENVMSGFGNNGGEEFMSFLQTGESMRVNNDTDWKKWYDNVSGKLVKIQNQDGSWNGHHCITSPAFCTATCLLILSIENDTKNRPILRGRDIKKYSYDFADVYLITTFPSLKIDIDKYPSVKQHLLSFGYDRLKQTGDIGARKKSNNKWFETQDSIGYWEDFSKQKLVWKRIGSILRFSLDETGCISLDSTCFAVGESIKYLTAFFNSKVGNYVLKDSPKTGTGDLLISVQAFDNIAIPKIGNVLEEKINALIDEIKRLDNEKEILKIEKHLDQIFYDLYDFNPDELAELKNFKFS